MVFVVREAGNEVLDDRLAAGLFGDVGLGVGYEGTVVFQTNYENRDVKSHQTPPRIRQEARGGVGDVCLVGRPHLDQRNAYSVVLRRSAWFFKKERKE